MRLLALATTLVLALALAAGCSGDDAGDAVGTVDTPDVQVPQGGEELQQEATRLEEVLNERVRSLENVRSLEDLERELETARQELESSADDLRELEVAEDLRDERARLEEQARQLAGELDEAARRVDDRDLIGALRALGDLNSLADLQAAIDRARQEVELPGE